MDPHSFIARAEAQRWLGIAEKLLISHDLVGSKTFAIRARESDPRLEAAEQILAIADTLLAAEKRVVGSNGSHQPDYYAILQLVRFVQDAEHVTSQYRRLAVLLNPHQNRFPYSDQAFQLVNDAYAVLSNPMRKSMYDSDLDYPPQQQMNSLGFNLEQQQQQHHQQQQQAHNFFSINHMSEQELPHQHQQQHQHQQLQQHNFLSQPNPVRPREQEHMFQTQVQPFQVTSPPHQQNRHSPQPSQHIQSPPATPQHPFSWPQAQQSQFQQQMQYQQIKQEHQIKQEQQMKHDQQMQQQMKQEQLKQQQLQQQQEEQRKQQQLLEEQRKQQQLLEEQRKQQQLLEEQRKQQKLLEEQRKQQQLLEDQRRQQQLLEEQRKQQQLLEEQRKQQQLLEEQRKQQQLLEEQRKQQQLLEEQRKQQQLLEEQRKQQQQLEEQRKQQQLQEEQRKQQQLQEEQRKQQQLLEEQRKQQQLQEEQRKQQQMQQEEQRKQQQMQEEQRKQQEQQQESSKQNAVPVQPPSQVNSNNGVREEGTETEAETEPVDDSPTFWTACPYCFYMYEYPRVYVECTLRCDHCKRAFQAVRISSPPPIIEGQDAYFYCWGFFPIGLSMPDLQGNNNKGRNSNWTPFSSLHVTSNNEQNHLNEQAAPKENPFVNKGSGPRIYIDDVTDDVFIGVSEPSSDSDTEWVGDNKLKLKKMDKGFKDRIQVLALRAMYTGNESVKNLKHGMQGGVEVPTLLVVETNKKNVGSNPRKNISRVEHGMGKLDLNVDFNNNEGKETAPRVAAGTRLLREQEEKDNIEGVGFFEGLDECLSILPILCCE